MIKNNKILKSKIKKRKKKRGGRPPPFWPRRWPSHPFGWFG
jgi:hypothetical protein